jgi:hypothetical protein
VLQVDLVRVAKEFGEQRVAHVDWPSFFHAFGHRRDVLLNLGCDLRLVGFGQGLHASCDVLHRTAYLIVVLQQEMENVAVGDELRIRPASLARPGGTASWAAGLVRHGRSAATTATLLGPWWAALSGQLTRGDNQHTQSQYQLQEIRSRVH